MLVLSGYFYRNGIIISKNEHSNYLKQSIFHTRNCTIIGLSGMIFYFFFCIFEVYATESFKWRTARHIQAIVCFLCVHVRGRNVMVNTSKSGFGDVRCKYNTLDSEANERFHLEQIQPVA